MSKYLDMTDNGILGRRSAAEIIDKGLADSTFRDKFPKAYDELLYVREDIALSITKVLNRSKK